MRTLIEKPLEFNRAVVHTTASNAGKVAGVIRDGLYQAFTIVRDAGATVVGQARSAADRTADEAAAGTRDVVGEIRSAVARTADRASSGVREVVGQARSQGNAAGDDIDDVVSRTGDRAVGVVDPGPSTGTPYEQWTKSELYERARQLDVDGRSAMSKDELVTALRAA